VFSCNKFGCWIFYWSLCVFVLLVALILLGEAEKVSIVGCDNIPAIFFVPLPATLGDSIPLTAVSSGIAEGHSCVCIDPLFLFPSFALTCTGGNATSAATLTPLPFQNIYWLLLLKPTQPTHPSSLFICCG